MASALALACSSSTSTQTPLKDAGPPSNHALKFNGTTDYAQAGTANFVASNSPQTISFWVSYLPEDAGKGTDDFLSLQRDIQSGLHIGIKNGALAAWRQYESPRDGPLVSSALPSENWHHIAYVLDRPDGGYLNTLYVDGKVTDTTNVPPNNVTPEIFLLGSSAEWTNHFAGYLDEIRVWKVARTAAEVQEEMSGAVHAKEPGLIVYFNRNEVLDGGLLLDNSGNGNNALLGGGDVKYMPTLVPSTRPQPSQ
jgi:hypothetical protein